MTLKQTIKRNRSVYRQWVYFGMPETFDKLNDSNRDVINAYKSERPNAMGYKFHVGFVEVKDAENLYNFCCDYVFDGIFGNMAKVQEAHEKYTKSGKIEDLENLQNVLEEASGICLVWC